MTNSFGFVRFKISLKLKYVSLKVVPGAPTIKDNEEVAHDSCLGFIPL